MVRKSKLGVAAALSAMLLLQGCTGGRGVEMASGAATHTAAANDDVATCEAESDAPEECAEHAEIERELRAAKATTPKRFVVR